MLIDKEGACSISSPLFSLYLNILYITRNLGYLRNLLPDKIIEIATLPEQFIKRYIALSIDAVVKAVAGNVCRRTRIVGQPAVVTVFGKDIGAAFCYMLLIPVQQR